MDGTRCCRKPVGRCPRTSRAADGPTETKGILSSGGTAAGRWEGEEGTEQKHITAGGFPSAEKDSEDTTLEEGSRRDFCLC